jgi:uncharacterized protein YjbI with pentapeptide repeats
MEYNDAKKAELDKIAFLLGVHGMANEHLDILKQGVEVWNKWREGQREIRANLSWVVGVFDANLSEVDLSGADLSGADLSEANLSRAYFWRANLWKANLNEANLSEANFWEASLIDTDLSGANLSKANLSGASLSGVDLSRANLTEADFGGAYISATVFGDVDLSTVKGLDTIRHSGPSTIGIDTIYHSKGNIPEVFLKGAGIDDTFITYIRTLIVKPIDYYTCFISYSSKDEVFAKRLYADLQSKGVRCWFAPEDLKIGEEFGNRIDETIRLYDKLMVILSQHSINSSWVEFEVKKALKKEQEQGKLMLFPIKLDETVMEAPEAWAADIRKKRHIGDFTKWKEHDAYQKAFARLLRDLKAEAPRRL